MHHWRMRLSTVIFLVAALGMIVSLAFIGSLGGNPWLAAKIFFLLGVILYIVGK